MTNRDLALLAFIIDAPARGDLHPGHKAILQAYGAYLPLVNNDKPPFRVIKGKAQLRQGPSFSVKTQTLGLKLSTKIHNFIHKLKLYAEYRRAISKFKNP